MVVFPNKSYRKLDIKYFNNDFYKWQDFINKSQLYCIKWNFLKELEFLFYIKIGRIKEWEVPSWHPFWKRYVKEEKKREIKHHFENLKEIKKNKDMLPILYNRDATIEHIYKRIEILNQYINS